MNRLATKMPARRRTKEEAAVAESRSELARVLLVDDDERNLLALKTVLEDLGDVVLARSGEEALRHLLKGDFAVILLDVYMPGMDGYETAQIIRSREQTKGIPIVFLSAINKEAEHLLRGYLMGAVDYVFKPVDPVILRSKVAVFVDLFQKTKEIERKARQEQELVDANLVANAERLRAERELRLAEQRQAAIIQSLPMVLYVAPIESDRIVPQFISGDFEGTTGFSIKEASDNPDFWTGRLHPDDREKVLRAARECLSSGRLSIEYRWQCANGHYKHLLDQAVLLKDSESRPIEFAGSIIDVTDQRSLETQLMQAQKMDAIGKLTGGIAHDFNNLLAAVIGGLSVLEKKASLETEQQHILGMTRRAAEQGSELVRRLLAFARRQKLEPQAIKAQSLKDAVSDLLVRTLGGLIHIDWQIDKGAWDVLADRVQLELALVNLIINARDAMPAGGTINVVVENRRLEADDDPAGSPGDYVRIAVLDSGMGISPADLQKVTEPFFTTKGVGKGTGLGLSMVYGFARQSNGAFTITSELGEGTVAELWLPRASDGCDLDRPARAEPSKRRRNRKLTVLLVDDHDEVRGTTAAVLRDFGHVVYEAANGSEAMSILERGDCAYDLLISDYAMPRVSGTDFLKKARQLCPGVPALIITGYADADAISDRPEGLQILQKPFTPTLLQAAISHVCETQPAAR